MTTLAAITNKHEDFYHLLGPFLARREVHRQVGGPIYDDDGKTWVIARDDQGQVLGFIGIRTVGGAAVAESCYLVDDTDNDLLAILVRAAVGTVVPTPVRATVRHSRAEVYAKAGFVEAGRTNGFAKVVHPGRKTA